MKHRSLAALAASILVASFIATMSAADAGVTLIGTGLVPGDSLDLSGLDGLLICQRDVPDNCIDRATLGGFGSGIAFTGHDNVFLAVPDRGPFDGRTNVPYLDRFHFFAMTVDPGAPFPNIKPLLLDTRFFKNESNKNFVGDAYAFNKANPLAALRFDPEGVSLSGDGNFFVSDEYGPYINEFDRQGHLVRRISVPAKFLIATPGGDVDSGGNSLELYLPTPAPPATPLYGNSSGRQANRGMEGLAITPDGRTLVGIMQNALIQDHGLNDAIPPGRVGRNNRILKIDVETGKTSEYVYVVDAINAGKGVNEMLAINSHEFLVLERDNLTMVPTPPLTVKQTPTLKRIYKIDLDEQGLTDVSNEPSLPAAPVDPTKIKPVTKRLFLDLLDPSYKVNTTQTIKDVIAEKIEGLAWGPDLPDGRHVLYVVSDNDLSTVLPTQIYAFAIDPAKADYQPQDLPGPLYPPGQVKKALKK